MSPPAAELDESLAPVTLRFLDATLERAFLDAYARSSLKQYRFGTIASLALLPLLYPWAAIVAPSVKNVFMLVVAIFMVPSEIACVALTFTRFETFRRHWLWLGAVTNTCFGVAILTMQAIEPEIVTPHAFVGLILINVFTHALFGSRFIHATITSVANVVLYFVLTAFIVPIPRVQCGSNTFWILLATLTGMVVSRYLERLRRSEFYQARLLAEERAKSERLLLNVLPEPIVARLKGGERAIADRFDDVTVLFSDLVGFTQLSERLTPERLVTVLNEVFTSFDRIAERNGLEKIKTIGDAYMVCGGVPVPRADHAEAIAEMALAMRDSVAELAARLGHPLLMRIGIHSGPVVAGVIGEAKFIYDLWGDTVNVASRMESHGVVGSIQVTEATRAHLAAKYELEARGSVDVKGKGPIATFLLASRKPAPA